MQDFIELEKKVLKIWEKEETFKKLQKKLKGGPLWSFFDGPITANNKMGVHHAWGRTIKDTFQRYKAMQGFDQRFQNGFDCQGLWVEVEVEKDLGLNSKKEIEKFGLAKFSKECRKRVDKFALVIVEQSKRLGQWMDWDNSYFTYDDDNIEHIWHFLKVCNEKGWLYKDHRVMPWCKRCGTSLSQHEMSDSYKEIKHPAVTVKFELVDGGSVNAWTTTAWTLPANSALAVNPKGKHKKLIGKEYVQPFTEEVFKIVPWDEVDDCEGTGVVHIAPGCGVDDFDLGKKLGLEVKTVSDSDLGENGKIITLLKEKGILVKKENYKHRYPVCWRCKEELVFKLDSEWFIRTKEVKPLMKKAALGVNWIPSGTGGRMQDWLENMGDWNISRKRYWGLPLMFYPCECGETTIVGSREELKDLSVDPSLVDKLPELHRPWIDKIKIKCSGCKEEVSRIPEVGDCWLDAGIVPFSTLKYLSDKKYWTKWFPANFIVEMREQIRLWYYSMLFMGVTLEGKSPYSNVLSYEKVYDEAGEPMHKSSGNAIWFDDGVEEMGADVMRWLYLGQNPKSNVHFSFKVGKEIRQMLSTYWNSYQFLVGFVTCERKGKKLIDKWILSRFNETVGLVTKSLDKFDTYHAVKDLEVFIDDLSNWFIRRSRKETNKEVLEEVLVGLTRLLAPFVPFVTDEIHRDVVGDSVHLSLWPRGGKVDAKLNSDMARVREICAEALGLRDGIKVRQPLAKLVVPGEFDDELLELIKEEVNVKEVVFGKKLKLDTVLTPELEREGADRDLIREIQVARKKAGFKPEDFIVLTYPGVVSDLVKEEVKAKEVRKGKFNIDKA